MSNDNNDNTTPPTDNVVSIADWKSQVPSDEVLKAATPALDDIPLYKYRLIYRDNTVVDVHGFLWFLTPELLTVLNKDKIIEVLVPMDNVATLTRIYDNGELATTYRE